MSLKSTRSYERDPWTPLTIASTKSLNPPALTSGILVDEIGLTLTVSLNPPALTSGIAVPSAASE